VYYATWRYINVDMADSHWSGWKWELYDNSDSSAMPFIYQNSPWCKIWVFMAGMGLANMLIAKAKGGPQCGPHYSIPQKEWGYYTDISGVVLGFLTFYPVSDGAYENFTWGYSPSTTIETNLLMPLQLMCMAIFIFCLMHNSGMIATVLNSAPVSELGSLAYPVYLFHYGVTAFVLGNTPLYKDTSKVSYNLFFFQGAIFPLGGLALACVMAWMVREYYLAAVMQYIAPLVRESVETSSDDDDLVCCSGEKESLLPVAHRDTDDQRTGYQVPSKRGQNQLRSRRQSRSPQL